MVEAGGGLLEHLDRLAIRSVASAPGLISPAMRSARPSARQFELLTREWGAPASAPSAMGKERLRAPAGKETAVKAHVTRVLLKLELNGDAPGKPTNP